MHTWIIAPGLRVGVIKFVGGVRVPHGIGPVRVQTMPTNNSQEEACLYSNFQAGSCGVLREDYCTDTGQLQRDASACLVRMLSCTESLHGYS